MSEIVYVFDVDGTLTPSRVRMDETFRQEFLEFQKTHTTCLVTGSDYPKTLEQVGEEVILNAELVFNCNANEVRRQNDIRYKASWKPGGLLLLTLEYEKRQSRFGIKTGNHIEVRTGCLNFSVLGRNATMEMREHYVEWDKRTNERVRIAERLRPQFPELDFTIGGETGIEVHPKGKDKSQVKEWVRKPIHFFGDKCEEGGNDYPLAKVSDKVYHVKNWQETQKILRTIT